MSNSQFYKPVPSAVTQSLVKPIQATASVSTSVALPAPDSPCTNERLPPRSPIHKMPWWNDKHGIWMYPKKVIPVKPRDTRYADPVFSPLNKDDQSKPLSPASKLQFDLACKKNQNSRKLDANLVLHNQEINQNELVRVIGEILKGFMKIPSSSVYKPAVGITDYLTVIAKSYKISFSTILISAFIYIWDFLLKQKAPVSLGRFSVYSLTLTAIMVATKVLDSEDASDSFYGTSGFAEVGQIRDANGKVSVKLLNELEGEFLARLDWNVFITPERFKKQLDELNFLYLTESSKTLFSGFSRERKFLVKSTIPDEVFKPGHYVSLKKG